MSHPGVRSYDAGWPSQLRSQVNKVALVPPGHLLSAVSRSTSSDWPYVVTAPAIGRDDTTNYCRSRFGLQHLRSGAMAIT